MAIASNGKLDPLLLLLTMIGGTCATASAQTINCIYDSDIDYEMERTRHRPMPSGRIQPLHALIFAIALACISFGVLAVYVNLLSALLAMSGIAFYVGIYTHLLKRHTPYNIVIGGAAGEIQALVGWADLAIHFGGYSEYILINLSASRFGNNLWCDRLDFRGDFYYESLVAVA